MSKAFGIFAFFAAVFANGVVDTFFRVSILLRTTLIMWNEIQL